MSGDAGFTHDSEVYPYYHNNRVNPNDTMMDEATSKSIYRPLDITKEEIRLLVLHPPLVADSTLRCTLLHTGFASPSIDAPTVPPYEALSYVWGDPNFCIPIWLNNKEVWVTPNLAYALSTLRHQGGDRVLWVDALCINQLDIAERAHQVTLMRKIYSRCQRDLAWVGPTLDIDCSEEDFDYVQPKIVKGMKLMDRIVHRDAQTLMSLEGRYKSRKGARALGTSETTMQVDRRETSQLNWLFKELCFWERVWIVQELSCAPRLTLVCEGAELEWESLSLFLRDEPYFDAFHAVGDIYGLTSNHHVFRECFVNVKIIEDQRERVHACLDKSHAADGSSSTLIDVLARFRRMKSTDPRDRIYALLGLVTQDHGIKVDYTKSIRDLYREVTASLINISGNLDAICQSPFELTRGPLALCAPGDRALSPSRGEPVVVLPSWTAEFNVNRQSSPQPVSVLFAQRDIFNAGKANCEVPCRLLGNSQETLVLRGSAVGCIGHIRPQDFYSGESPSQVMQNYLEKDVLDDTSRYLYEPNLGAGAPKQSETAFQAFWRTMARDCTSPPRMRRLLKSEIAALTISNERDLKSGEEIRTCRSTASNNTTSAFTYNDDAGESEASFEVDDGPVQLKLTRLPYDKQDFMFAMCRNGVYVLTRPYVKEGDIVVVVDGGKVPVILRKFKEDETNENLGTVYHFVAVAYVHGFMDGEAEDGVAEGWLKKEDFAIA
ncbi:heterokaryon incompatibility protein-domain-containing protein [Ilyonectria sp. MPI-CAGE-AT-0026]|nr:heterokaryon incompatibility protein-domain-containing protein [Ilyonectria sp. MPI-CAGE-AT-0026]